MRPTLFSQKDSTPRRKTELTRRITPPLKNGRLNNGERPHRRKKERGCALSPAHARMCNLPTYPEHNLGVRRLYCCLLCRVACVLLLCAAAVLCCVLLRCAVVCCAVLWSVVLPRSS